MAVHLYYTMITTFEDEPWDIVNQTPAGPEQGLEAYRRINHRYDPTGPRSARLVLRRIVNARPVEAAGLRGAVETMEECFREYAARSNAVLPEALRMTFLEQLLSGDIARHVELNCESLNTYDRLRAEIWRYAERVHDARRQGDPRQIGGVSGGRSKR